MSPRFKLFAFMLPCSLAVALLWPLSGCNGSQAHAADSTQVVDSSRTNNVSPDTAEVKKPEQLPPSTMPALKPAAELEKLEKMHTEALAAERKLLSTPALDKAMDALKDFTGADGIPIHGEIADAQFAALTVRERLAYALWHPEAWSEDETNVGSWAGKVHGIARQLPSDPSGGVLGERQVEALRKDTTALKKIVLECLNTHKSVSIPLMRIIADFKIFEAVLPLVAIYQAQTTKDDLILTTLSILMEKGMYWKWLASEPFKSMLVDAHGMVPLRPENAEQFIAFAQAFAAR